jgi:hypothetical protein
MATFYYKMAGVGKKMPPQVVAHPGSRPTDLRRIVDTKNSTAPEPHPSPDEHPHACNDGWVTIGQLVVDPETGEETEEYALYLCRRCAGEETEVQS